MKSLLVLISLGSAMTMSLATDLPERATDLPKRVGFPDVLTMLDGTAVTTKEQWLNQRKPELRELFQQYMYGRYPTNKKRITPKLLFRDAQAMDGKATFQEIELDLGISADCPKMYVFLAMPNQRPKAGNIPVFVGMNFSGNHAITDHPKIRIPTAWMYDKYPGVKNNQATDAGRGSLPDKWPLDIIIDNGYALATFYSGDIDPDRKDARQGVRAYLTPKLDEARGDSTSTIMAWAWGIHRVVDLVEKVSGLDARKIAVVGHSRNGKTALLAGALDDRIAVVIPHQAGCGGTGPSRHNDPKAESVKRINTSFPHWFCPNFKAFNDATDKIPFDQHCLVAMCAPRPVLYSNATLDQWANPKGQFEMLKKATPVYKLFNSDGLSATDFPEVGKLIDSPLGFWIREGKHEANRDDWKMFIRYTTKHLNNI